MWFALQTKARQEQRAREHLENQDYAVFMPRIRVEKLRGGKSCEQIEPLFPGYLFLQLRSTTGDWNAIRSTRGVLRIVAFGGSPSPVPDQFIDHLRSELEAAADYVEPLFKIGQRVQILEGPFKHLEGILKEIDGEKRAILMLELLGKTQKLVVPTNFLQAT